MITVYTKEGCTKCEMVKKTIKEKGLEYIEKSLSDPDNLTELLIAGIEITEAPVIENNGEFFTNKNGLLRGIK
jgi:glutaredoxin